MKKEYEKPEVTLSMNGSLEGVFARSGSNKDGSFRKSCGSNSSGKRSGRKCSGRPGDGRH